MRIYSNARDLMSEMGRELNSYGQIVKPKHYQNKSIEGNEDFITKEIICQQYCLTSLPDPEYLFKFTNTQEWAEVELEERITALGENPGKAWRLNRSMWEEFLTEEGKFDYTYSERMSDVVTYKGTTLKKLSAIIQLLKDDPDTRKAILNIYGGYHHTKTYDQDYLDGSRRIPCSMYYDFLLREGPKGTQLNICYHQRSADFVQHFGDDVYLAWNLMTFIAERLEIKPGYLYHTIDSLHSYKKDWGLLRKNIDEL